ncbi:MAG TPA: hypothetical protein VN605_13980 [Thermoanaerobaculia bacterium]|nr:hypothetical protein [Thermoanaerobaculia bacterium]
MLAVANGVRMRAPAQKGASGKHDDLSSSGRGSFPVITISDGNAAEKLLKSTLNCCGEHRWNVVEKLLECCWKTVDENRLR